MSELGGKRADTFRAAPCRAHLDYNPGERCVDERRSARELFVRNRTNSRRSSLRIRRIRRIARRESSIFDERALRVRRCPLFIFLFFSNYRPAPSADSNGNPVLRICDLHSISLRSSASRLTRKIGHFGDLTTT